MEAVLAEQHDLTDDEITAFIADPATIPTHEIALEVIGCLDEEIANIQTQIDAAMIESNMRPLSEERQAWARRASYAAAMRRNERHRVMQRDKEIRGTKGKPGQKDPNKAEAGKLKQERLKLEAETRRDAKKLAILEANNRAAAIAQQRRELAATLNFAHRFYKVAQAVLPPEQLAELQSATHNAPPT